VETEDQMEEACRDLASLGAQAVLLKGGHAEGEISRDFLYVTADQSFNTFESKRIDTPNLHGTGCTLSSAIAAHLAQGLEMREAVAEAKRYISEAIVAGADYSIGQGHGPVHHFYRSWS
ncbi:MAG: bifunctional hydroxymethylpyrimidine kinase/phosphomethylpyrimidine kinase, partial [Chloroflexota bacterium]